MCLSIWLIDLFLPMLIVLLLSILIGSRYGSLFSNSPTKRPSHVDSLVARLDAMYSASQVEVATQVCFLDLRLMAPLQLRMLHQYYTY